MTITVYGAASTTSTKSVVATLIEKGLTYELKSVDIFGGGHTVKLN